MLPQVYVAMWRYRATHLCRSEISREGIFNTLRPRQNGRHFPYDIFKCIILFENVWIWIKISLKFVLKIRINNIPALVQIMAWRRPGDKPLSEPMMVRLPTHICVTRPQWVNSVRICAFEQYVILALDTQMQQYNPCLIVEASDKHHLWKSKSKLNQWKPCDAKLPAKLRLFKNQISLLKWGKR